MYRISSGVHQKNIIALSGKKMETVSKIENISSNELANERTALAYERTLMAWIRTAVSLISFGFTIYKFLGEMDEKDGSPGRILSARVVGMIMIAFGFTGLLLAQIQHHLAIKKLRRSSPSLQRSISSLLSILILVFGLLMFLAALFRQ
jgi:putative membrane protein